MHKYCVFAGHFSLLCLILIYMSPGIYCQVTKCCSKDFVLDIESDYSCELYNLPIASVLNCSDFRNVFVGDETHIELNGCIDKNSNGQYISISCSQDFLHSSSDVHLLNKCCPTRQSYDYSQRFCIKDVNSHVRFEEIFGEAAVVLRHNVPNCSADDVFVEYISTAHTIQFDGMNLIVNHDTLPPDKFCIEDLINTDPEHHAFNKSESHIIIRSCRSRDSVCTQIPCMRRCCKVDQVMEARPGGYKICQYHPYKMNLQPTFYNVSLPLDNSRKQAFIKGLHDLQLARRNRIRKLKDILSIFSCFLSSINRLFFNFTKLEK